MTDPYVATAAGVYGIGAVCLIVGMLIGALLTTIVDRADRPRVEDDEHLTEWRR